jgi:porphobilinogen synthase
VFVLEGASRVEDIPSMPGVERQSLDRLLSVAERALASVFRRWRCSR